ncbi:uncharacterized protein N7529_010208 [Penicillium soppii]|uniref:uncharacterized protein n=1 Tax=Penicillium soppii TaxID=69789 RepID=UPI0025482648|nr:uncharacterized protein N7529_010208 [Penicillium soppii]KAJ5856264.1 hypothetical protein N7529_010208 [Penicillium soppii]
MPEEYEGQHLHTSRSLCNTDMKDMKDVISVVLFLLSNNLSFRIAHGQGQGIDDPRDLSNLLREDDVIMATIEVSGLNSPEFIKHLLRLGGVTAETIVERLFASAVRNRNFQLFVTMLQAGVDPNLTFLGGKDEEDKHMSLTALEFAAARYNQRESVQWARLLLFHNAIPGQPGWGSSALELAFMNQNEKLVNMLVQIVPQVSPDLIGRCLEATGNLKIARTCLEFCDEINKGFELSITYIDTRRTGPGTLLGVVCWNMRIIEATVIAKHLLERGAKVDAWHIFPAPAHGQEILVTTPLGLAAARGNLQLMKILLQAGANLKPDGVLGCLSPLVLAVHYKQHFAVKLLKKWGAPSSCRSGRRLSTSSIENRNYILALADPQRPGAAPGEPKRIQKHPATFQCSLCPKRFTRAYNLRSHLRNHTDERPFVCTVCGKAFARQDDRKRHECLHSGENKFVCCGDLSDDAQWGCGRRFARADALGRHLRSEAGVVGTYFVDPETLCNLRYPSSDRWKMEGWCRWTMAPWWNWAGENKAHPATFASENMNLQFSQAQSDSQTLVHQSISLLEDAVEKSEQSMFSILLQVDAWTPEDLGKAIVKSLQLDRKDLTPGLLASAAKLYKKGLFCSSLNLGPKETDAQTVNHLVLTGCSLDYIFGSPKMALCEAIEYEQMALVDILLTAGVHLDEVVAPAQVSAFFQIAVKQSHHKLMDMLLLAGADVNTPATSRDMGTALQIAVEKENLQLTQWLLEIGANVNGAPWRDSGRTALQAAVLQGNLELVNKLLDMGADVNQSPADSSGATALQLAAIRGYIRIAQQLIGRGANINASRGHHFGRTALEGAAEHGRTDMLQLLLNGGSFLEGEGRRELIRAVKLAMKNERHAISRYLKSFIDWNDSDNECYQKEVFDQEEEDMLGKLA